jgi:serine/threonine protein kinase
LKELGEGGFGKVILAEHRITKEKVAIKTIKTEVIGSAADIDNVFVEAEILKSLNHENIVRVINCLTLQNMQVAIIMEYLQGGELLAYVDKKGRLS